MRLPAALSVAILLGSPAAADPARDFLAVGEAACAEFDGGTFNPGDAVTRIDLTGDGELDTLVDESRFSCSTASSLYCGSGGCMLHGIVAEAVTSWQATGWRTIEWAPDTILLIGRDGGWCGGAGSDVCYEALKWSNDRFLSVMPSGPE